MNNWIEAFKSISEEEDIFQNEYFSFYWDRNNLNFLPNSLISVDDFNNFYNNLNFDVLNNNELTILIFHIVSDIMETNNITNEYAKLFDIVFNNNIIKNNVKKLMSKN